MLERGAALRIVDHLRSGFARSKLCAHILNLRCLFFETRSELRNRCAEVRCCSWSQREGRVSDRKTGMCCKCVVDDKIPALASSLAQGRRGAGSSSVVPPQVKRTVHPGSLIVPTGISSRFAATKHRPGRKVRVVGFATLVARFVNQGLSPAWDILGIKEPKVNLNETTRFRASNRCSIATE